MHSTGVPNNFFLLSFNQEGDIFCSSKGHCLAHDDVAAVPLVHRHHANTTILREQMKTTRFQITLPFPSKLAIPGLTSWGKGFSLLKLLCIIPDLLNVKIPTLLKGKKNPFLQPLMSTGGPQLHFKEETDRGYDSLQMTWHFSGRCGDST